MMKFIKKFMGKGSVQEEISPVSKATKDFMNMKPGERNRMAKEAIGESCKERSKKMHSEKE